MVDIIERLARVQPKISDEDYQQDGLWYCGKCRTPKQCYVNLFGRERIVTCQCDCEAEEYEAERFKRELEETMQRIAEARTRGIQDKQILNCRFENDDQRDGKMSALMHRYVDHWKDMYESSQGMLFSGDVGCGKTFYAGCIANALIEKMVPVMVTDFPKILAALQSDSDRLGYIEGLNRYALLVIDDLGVERNSDYALEQVFSVINSRYKSGKPLIVTTNLSVEEIRNPKDIKYSRIYDRILEMCIPIRLKGESRRGEIGRTKVEESRRILLSPSEE